MTRLDLRREGIRTFADLAVVGAVLVFVAQIMGPARGATSGIAQAAVMVVAAALLAGPVVAVKLLAIGETRPPIGGTMKILLNLVQVGGYAGLWGAIAATSALLSSIGLAE